MVETREIQRWVKKGYALVIVAIIIDVLARTFGLTNWHQLLLVISDNPTNALSTVLGLSITSIIFIFLVYPVTIGYFIELIDRRIRR